GRAEQVLDRLGGVTGGDVVRGQGQGRRLGRRGVGAVDRPVGGLGRGLGRRGGAAGRGGAGRGARRRRAGRRGARRRCRTGRAARARRVVELPHRLGLAGCLRGRARRRARRRRGGAGRLGGGRG